MNMKQIVTVAYSEFALFVMCIIPFAIITGAEFRDTAPADMRFCDGSELVVDVTVEFRSESDREGYALIHPEYVKAEQSAFTIDELAKLIDETGQSDFRQYVEAELAKPAVQAEIAEAFAEPEDPWNDPDFAEDRSRNDFAGID